MEGLLEIQDEHVGLEVRAIPELNQAFHSHRQELLSRIRYWQAHRSRKLTAAQVQELIYDACIEHSKTSTMYAQYVADYHARRILQEQL